MTAAEKRAARGGKTRDEVVAAVFVRDGFRCTKCGKTNEEHKAETDKALEVHRTVPGSIYCVDGCILLCRQCHDKEPKRIPGEIDLEGSHRGGVAIRLPGVYRAKMHELKKKTRIPITALVQLAFDAHLKQIGIEPPQAE